MSTEVPLLDSKVLVTNGFSRSVEGFDYFIGSDVLDSIEPPDGRDWGVFVCTRITPDAFDDCSPCSDWAHEKMFCSVHCYCVSFLIFLLHFEGDRYAIGVFKFGMVMRQEPPISKELDVPDLQDICSAQVSLRHL